MELHHFYSNYTFTRIKAAHSAANRRRKKNAVTTLYPALQIPDFPYTMSAITSSVAHMNPKEYIRHPEKENPPCNLQGRDSSVLFIILKTVGSTYRISQYGMWKIFC